MVMLKTVSTSENGRGTDAGGRLFSCPAAVGPAPTTGRWPLFSLKMKRRNLLDQTSHGIPYTPNFVTQHFKIVLRKNGLREISFHDLRHTCASLLLKNGVSMKEIQEWLGHSNFSTTANIYAHLDTSSKNTSAARMNESFSISPGIRPDL